MKFSWSQCQLEELSKKKTINVTGLLKNWVKQQGIKRLKVSFYGYPKLAYMSRVVDLVKNAHNITTLCILGVAEDDGVIEQLVNLTRVKGNLTRLELGDGFFSSSQLVDFLNDLVHANCQLKALHFDMCAVSGKEEQVGKFLAANLPMEYFGLRAAGIAKNDAQEAKYIAEGLAQNTHLKELDLRDNECAIDGVLPVLQNNRSITSVDFRGNSASEKTIESIAEVLKNNDTLRILRFTQFEFFSLNPIWDSLKHNQSLTELDITYEAVDEYPAPLMDLDLLKDMMAVNRSLTTFSLCKNITNVIPEISNLSQTFTERNKLEQRLNVTNTLQTIAMISKSKSFLERLPKDVWRHMFSFVAFPGIVKDFASLIYWTNSC